MRKTQGSVTPIRDRYGVVRYQARLTVDGERRSFGTYRTAQEARDALADVCGGLEDRVEKGYTLVAWGERWLQGRKTDGLLRAQHKAASAWNTHVASASFANWPLRKIKRTDVVGWIKKLLKTEAVHGAGDEAIGLGRRLSRQTVSNALSLLRKALNDAADEGHVPANVALGVTVPRVPRKDEPWTWLRKEEIDALFAVRLRPEQCAIFSVAVYCGLRGGELWGLRWSDVKEDELVIARTYEDRPTKSGKVRRVPLLPQAKAALAEWKKFRPGIGDALVFPSSGKSPRGKGRCHCEGYQAGLKSVLRRAGITRRVRLHDLRHTCASHLVQGTWLAPMRLEDVRLWGGWSTIVMVERYAHLCPDRLHALVRAHGEQEDERKRKERK